LKKNELFIKKALTKNEEKDEFKSKWSKSDGKVMDKS